MKLKLYILVVPILLASYVCVDAQNNLNILKYYSTEDSLNIDPYSFFPMQVGNFWQYAFLNEIVSEKTVVKDSVLENGHRLIWINSLDNPVWEIDINSRVFQYSPPDVEWTNLHYQLDANLGEEWIMSYSPDDSTRYFYRKVEAIFEAEYLGIKTIFKEIAEYSRDGNNGDYLRHKYILGAGLGIVNKRNDSMVEPPEYLLSAIINGDTLGTIVGVKDNYSNVIPTNIELFQNYPNPFNPSTTISYKLQQTGYTQLKIYSILGEEIKTIVNEYQPIGNYNYKVDMNGLPSGIYMYTLVSNKSIFSKKMIYLK